MTEVKKIISYRSIGFWHVKKQDNSSQLLLITQISNETLAFCWSINLGFWSFGNVENWSKMPCALKEQTPTVQWPLFTTFSHHNQQIGWFWVRQFKKHTQCNGCSNNKSMMFSQIAPWCWGFLSIGIQLMVTNIYKYPIQFPWLSILFLLSMLGPIAPSIDQGIQRRSLFSHHLQQLVGLSHKQKGGVFHWQVRLMESV